MYLFGLTSKLKRVLFRSEFSLTSPIPIPRSSRAAGSRLRVIVVEEETYQREGDIMIDMARPLRAAVLALGFCAQKAFAQPCSPNLCSGHGTCESSKDGSTSARQCSCNTGWTGADCSLKLCPYGPAWSDKARGTDDAHTLAECSNRGRCDRAEGVCICDAGFEGQACGRRSCPNNCEDHGRCQSLYYFASMQDPGEGTVYTYEDVWDAFMLYGCNCDPGFSGPSCGLRTCAVGDDPLTGTDEVGRF